VTKEVDRFAYFSNLSGQRTLLEVLGDYGSQNTGLEKNALYQMKRLMTPTIWCDTTGGDSLLLNREPHPLHCLLGIEFQTPSA
jgi:hypothetical protein